MFATVDNLPSLSAPPRLLGPFCHPRNLQSATLLLLNPPWSSMTLNHKIPSHLRDLYMHLLEILTFHYTRTQLWNQAHNRHRFSPFQHRLILSQKCRPSGKKLREFYKRRRMRHGLLASAGTLCRETSSLYCRLINESITWKSYMWDLPHGDLKLAVNSSMDTLPTFTNLRRWGKRASVNCQLCGNVVKQTLFHVLVHCKHIGRGKVDLEAQFHPESHCGLPEVCPCEQEYS
jgi:hypothetical protein